MTKETKEEVKVELTVNDLVAIQAFLSRVNLSGQEATAYVTIQAKIQAIIAQNAPKEEEKKEDTDKKED